MTPYTVGIDIGGTSTKFGLADRKGNVFTQASLPMQDFEDFSDFFDSLSDAIRHAIGTAPKDYQLAGIGVGAANGNYLNGNIENAVNLKWKDTLPMGKKLKEEFNVPCLVTNDANAAAVGEMIYGNAKGMKDFVIITLGTGLGSGFVCGGDLINGHNGIAGELGHTTVNPNGRYCNCGKRGCLETYASATGIKRTVYKLLADHLEPSELRGISFEDLNTKMITDAANRGDAVAKEAFEYTGRVLGMKLSDTVVHTDPEAIFLFGGLAQAGHWIFEPTIYNLEKNLMPQFRGKVNVLPSGLENQTAPILGASSLVWDHLEKEGKK